MLSGPFIAKVPRPAALDLSANAETVTNEFGGKQSKLTARMDLMPPAASLHVAGVLGYGAAKYGEDNWRRISTRDHLNHALVHAFAFLSGDKQDDHLGHFACRAMMALEIWLTENEANDEK